MAHTTEQLIANEKHFIGMMRITKIYIWIDEKEIYEFKDNKIIPATVKGWLTLQRIVRPSFFTIFVNPPSNP
jgi:hypothetical protein